MKKKPLTLMKWLGVGLVTLLFAACSGDSDMKALLEQVPGNADFVAVGKSSDILESIGGSLEDNSKIVLPKEILDEMPSDAEKGLDEANDNFEDTGLDINCAAAFGNYDDRIGAIVVAINDEDKFTKYVKDKYDGDKDTDEDNDFTIYSTGEDAGRHVFVHDGYAYFFDGYDDNKEASRNARKILNAVDDEDYASTNFADYIVDSNVFGAAFKLPKELRDMAKQSGIPSEIANLYNGVVLVRGTVSDEEVSVDVKLVDKEGNDMDTEALKKIYNTDARISADALAYMGKNEQAVFACALKDFKWNKYLEPLFNSSYMDRDEAAAISVVKGFLNKMDGTIAVGIGLNKGLESIAAMEADDDQILSQVSGTIVIETKDGKATTILNDLKSFLSQNGVTYNDMSDGLYIEVPGTAVKFYAHADGNMFVLSNHEINKNNGNPAVSALNFTDFISAAAIAFTQNSQLMKDLGLNNDVVLSCTSDIEKMEISLKLKVSGSATTLANLIKMALNVAKHGDKINSKFREYRDQYNSYTDYYNPYDYANDSTGAYGYEETAVEEAAPADEYYY